MRISENPLPRLASALIKQSEEDWQKQLIDLLHLHGYKICEFRKARIMKGGVDSYRTPFGADGVGFPDLVVVHPVSGNAFAVECKSDTGKMRPEQYQWQEWLVTCGIMHFTWRPKDWDWIVEVVKALSVKEIEV